MNKEKNQHVGAMTTRLDDDLCEKGPGRQLAGIAAVQLSTIQHCRTPLKTVFSRQERDIDKVKEILGVGDE